MGGRLADMSCNHRIEALDTFVLARAAAMHHKVAVHKLRDTDWDRLERQVTTAPAAASGRMALLGQEPVRVGNGFFPTKARVRPTDLDGVGELGFHRRPIPPLQPDVRLSGSRPFLRTTVGFGRGTVCRWLCLPARG